jgi:hypothetical protein
VVEFFLVADIKVLHIRIFAHRQSRRIQIRAPTKSECNPISSATIAAAVTGSSSSGGSGAGSGSEAGGPGVVLRLVRSLMSTDAPAASFSDLRNRAVPHGTVSVLGRVESLRLAGEAVADLLEIVER